MQFDEKIRPYTCIFIDFFPQSYLKLLNKNNWIQNVAFWMRGLFSSLWKRLHFQRYFDLWEAQRICFSKIKRKKKAWKTSTFSCIKRPAFFRIKKPASIVADIPLFSFVLDNSRKRLYLDHFLLLFLINSSSWLCVPSQRTQKYDKNLIGNTFKVLSL